MTPKRIVKSGVVRLKRRVADLSVAENQRGRKDRTALVERYAWLATFEADAARSADELRPDHADYIANVGHPVHAASLELAAFLDVTLRHLRPGRVADLGSGFTSYVVRRHAATASPSPVSFSVDDAAEWLEKTRTYIDGKGLSTDGLCTWADFVAGEPAPFDLVVHDMGSMEFRAETLETVLGLVRPGGLLLLDDMHKAEFRSHALAVLEREKLEHYSLKPFTRDDLTRYAYAVCL